MATAKILGAITTEITASHKAGNGMDAVVKFSHYMISSTTHDSLSQC